MGVKWVMEQDVYSQNSVPRSYDHLIPTSGSVVQCSRSMNYYCVDWYESVLGRRWEMWNPRVLFLNSIYFIPKIVYSCHLFVGFCLNSYLSLLVLQQFLFSNCYCSRYEYLHGVFIRMRRRMIFRFIYFQLIDRVFRFFCCCFLSVSVEMNRKELTYAWNGSMLQLVVRKCIFWTNF